MRQLRFTLWAIGNLLLAGVIIVASWAGAIPIALLIVVAWPIAVALLVALPVGTVLWPGWLVGRGAISVALVRLAG